jgi:hypothetical protein
MEVGPGSLIQVKALVALYSKDISGHAVLRDFDLVAANSIRQTPVPGRNEKAKLNLRASRQERRQ